MAQAWSSRAPHALIAKMRAMNPRLPLLLASCLLCAPVLAARPPILTPASPQALVEELPRGYAQLEPAAIPRAPLANARRLLAAAAETGDARLATRAQAILDRMPKGGESPELLRLRAYAAQHRHDFAAALQALDRLVALQPRDGDARLARAQILIVQGRLEAARGDCAALALGIDAGQGLLCAAALSLRRGRLDAAAMLSERWLAAAGAGDERRRYGLLLRAEAASRAGAGDAEAWYRQALALGARDPRTLAAYSRHLRRRGEAARAYALLADAPPSDGLRLERALAARMIAAPDAAALAEEVGRRLALTRQLGGTPELRDEAEYLLTLRGDAAGALRLARANVAHQRDYEDLDLLRRATATLAARR